MPPLWSTRMFGQLWMPTEAQLNWPKYIYIYIYICRHSLGTKDDCLIFNAVEICSLSKLTNVRSFSSRISEVKLLYSSWSFLFPYIGSLTSLFFWSFFFPCIGSLTSFFFGEVSSVFFCSLFVGCLKQAVLNNCPFRKHVLDTFSFLCLFWTTVSWDQYMNFVSCVFSLSREGGGFCPPLR